MTEVQTWVRPLNSTRNAIDFPLLSVAARLDVDEGTIEAASVVVSALASRPRAIASAGRSVQITSSRAGSRRWSARSAPSAPSTARWSVDSVQLMMCAGTILPSRTTARSSPAPTNGSKSSGFTVSPFSVNISIAAALISGTKAQQGGSAMEAQPHQDTTAGNSPAAVHAAAATPGVSGNS